MQNKLYFLFIIPLFFGCSNSHNVETYTSENEVTVTAGRKRITITPIIESSWGGRGDQGGLAVSNGDQIDTIYDCTYGRTPDYKILKCGSREYLFTSCLMNGAGSNRQSFYLWSLNNKNFMKQLLFKELYTGKEGVYDTITGVLIGTDNININLKTPEIKNWIVDSLNEEVHWLMEKDYEFSIEKNKAIIIVDSTYSLLQMSDEITPLEILKGKRKLEFKFNVE